MSNKMPYAEQEEIVYQWLRFRPDMSMKEAQAAFKAVFAVTLTGSNYTQAKERIDALPARPEKPKQKYLVALGMIYPTLTEKQVNIKTLKFFGELTRDDQVRYWFHHAQSDPPPMSVEEAKAIIEEVERRQVGGTSAFDLDTPISQETPDL